MTPASVRLRGPVLMGWCAWLVCFAVLARFGTWLPFALIGVTLTLLALRFGSLPRAALRPSSAHVAAGVLAGAFMVAFTHGAYAWLALVLPWLRPALRELFGLLEVAGFSALERATLIVVIASCEEVLFRGPLLISTSRSAKTWRLGGAELSRILGFAIAYAFTTAPLGSPLLILCALACGIAWGAMTVITRSLTMPILAHVIWDLGVLVLWPLSNPL